MLKIRISGTKAELEKIVSSIEGGEIKKFKHHGAITYAIDSTTSVSSFLEKNQAQDTKHLTSEEKLKNIHHDLSDLLDVMKDDN